MQVGGRKDVSGLWTEGAQNQWIHEEGTYEEEIREKGSKAASPFTGAALAVHKGMGN
jgi:hypothetical protein